MKAFVKTNEIETVRARGASQIWLQNEWDADRPLIDLEGACSLNGAIKGNQLQAKVNGASHLIIEGNADYFDIEAEGASTMSGFNFAANVLSTDNGLLRLLGCTTSCTVCGVQSS